MRVELPLEDLEGRRVATLVILTRPHRVNNDAELLDRRGENDDDGLEPVQLVEGAEYRFEVLGVGSASVSWEPRELFDADDIDGHSGRLRPRLATGRVEVVAEIDGQRTRPVAIEVRSIKLGYLGDYRRMLESIARLGSELVLERFAASAQRLRIDDETSSSTLYQRFVLLQALLDGERLQSGVRRILAAPHIAWEQREHAIGPGQPMRGGGMLGRTLCGPGPRREWSESPIAGLNTLPRTLTQHRAEETLDSIPNRFVKHAIEQWRALIVEVQQALEREAARIVSSGRRVSSPVRRGLEETGRLSTLLDECLRHPVFLDVGLLNEFPASNQVLQKRDGYRDVFETYVLYEFGAALTWQGGEDVFSGGQRDVATLYEYWVFLELARIVADISSVKPDLSSLIGSTANSMSLLLRRGEARSVSGLVERRGRTWRLELWFNQSFSATVDGASWTRTMRPDCSLSITPIHGVSPEAEPLWLHFDAKYRIDGVVDLDASQDDDPVLTAKSEDLLKMHAYRDAIVRAAGAYVVFPGTKPSLKQRHGEFLPSLGAFALRPGTGSSGEGAERITAFLNDVIDQLANQGSPFERARFWTSRSFAADASPNSASNPSLNAVSFLTAPAADTVVLVAFLRDEEHAAWVETRLLYNLRADGERDGALAIGNAALAATLVLTYGDDGVHRLYAVVDAPAVMTKVQLLNLGYPQPGGEVYFVMKLREMEQAPDWLARIDLGAMLASNAGQPRGAPFALSWMQIAAMVLR